MISCSVFRQCLKSSPLLLHGKLVASKCDVRNEEEIKAVFQFARTQFGGVDVCVNNAGLNRAAPLLTGSTEAWRQTMEVYNDSRLVMYSLAYVFCMAHTYRSMY